MPIQLFIQPCVPDLNLNRSLVPASHFPCKYFWNPTSLLKVLYMYNQLNFTVKTLIMQLAFLLTNTSFYSSNKKGCWTISPLQLPTSTHPYLYLMLPLYLRFSSVYLYNTLYSSPNYKAVWDIYPQAYIHQLLPPFKLSFIPTAR